MSSPSNIATGGPKHERTDIEVRAVAIALASVMCVVVIAAFLVKGMLAASGSSRAGPTETPPPAPIRLNSDPAAEIAAYQDEKRRQLDSYGWVDRDRGIAHVPIARAMQMMAEREQRGSP
jgi:hypothetical protein